MELVFDDKQEIKYRDKPYIASRLALQDKYQLYLLRKVLRRYPGSESVHIIFPDTSDLYINSDQIRAFLMKPVLTKPIRETFLTLKIQKETNSFTLLIIGAGIILLFLLSFFLIFYKNVHSR